MQLTGSGGRGWTCALEKMRTDPIKMILFCRPTIAEFYIYVYYLYFFIITVHCLFLVFIVL